MVFQSPNTNNDPNKKTLTNAASSSTSHHQNSTKKQQQHNQHSPTKPVRRQSETTTKTASSSTSTSGTKKATTTGTAKPTTYLRRPRTLAVADMEEFWTLKRANPIWEDQPEEEDIILYHDDAQDTSNVVDTTATTNLDHTMTTRDVTSMAKSLSSSIQQPQPTTHTSRSDVIYSDDDRIIAYRY